MKELLKKIPQNNLFQKIICDRYNHWKKIRNETELYIVPEAERSSWSDWTFSEKGQRISDMANALYKIACNSNVIANYHLSRGFTLEDGKDFYFETIYLDNLEDLSNEIEKLKPKLKKTKHFISIRPRYFSHSFGDAIRI
ncbi:MAG: hypothetical protein CL760_12755 [Chloroflexi bacterium]|nr:hypothetical protein [Chloroflexota bacterium]|tara:strand:- start:35130 stop:35549 length:420 start_codon:yes stop_codon:yes gene_type:complete